MESDFIQVGKGYYLVLDEGTTHAEVTINISDQHTGISLQHQGVAHKLLTSVKPSSKDTAMRGHPVCGQGHFLRTVSYLPPM